MISNTVHVISALVAGPLLGGLISGLDRIITARLQSRIGPPVLQPFYDVIKLLGKEKMFSTFDVFRIINCSVTSVFRVSSREKEQNRN